MGGLEVASGADRLLLIACAQMVAEKYGAPALMEAVKRLAATLEELRVACQCAQRMRALAAKQDLTSSIAAEWLSWAKALVSMQSVIGRPEGPTVYPPRDPPPR